MARSKANPVDVVRGALRAVFDAVNAGQPDVLVRCLERDVHPGKTNPGGWTATATVVVYCEGGAWESPCYERFWMDAWAKVDDECVKRGLRVHHEPVNGAVVIFYED